MSYIYLSFIVILRLFVVGIRRVKKKVMYFLEGYQGAD